MDLSGQALAVEYMGSNLIVVKPERSNLSVQTLVVKHQWSNISGQTFAVKPWRANRTPSARARAQAGLRARTDTETDTDRSHRG